MEYREFLNKVKPDLEAMMPGNEVSVSDIRKLQGMSYYGISVKPEGSIIATSLNLNAFHQRFEEGQDYRQILDGIVNAVRDAMVLDMQIPLDSIKDYDQVKEKLSVRLVGREGNEDRLLTIPHHDMEDGSTNLLPVVLLVVVLAAGGGFYAYTKVKGKKKEETKPDPDADYEDEDDETDYELPDLYGEDAEADYSDEDDSDFEDGELV